MKLKNIIAFIASVMILGTGVGMGGVEVNGKVSNQQQINFKRLLRYVTVEQPASIKKNIIKTVKKNKGKRYPCSALSESSIKQLYSRFNVNYNSVSRDNKSEIVFATHATECYLHSKIENNKVLGDGIVYYVKKYYGGSYKSDFGDCSVC
jgi:hypothetical protein